MMLLRNGLKVFLVSREVRVYVCQIKMCSNWENITLLSRNSYLFFSFQSCIPGFNEVYGHKPMMNSAVAELTFLQGEAREGTGKNLLKKLNSKN